jgi:asparagine synthase (glutamine-hydrolysing)
MCGIVGVYGAHEGYPVSEGTLAAMLGSLVHRGPDEEGRFISSGIGLGCRRLSIVDLEGGNQPHFNEDRSIVSVCNGEIYNHRELRAELEARGHVFRSRCDVEVLVHLYEEEGPRCFRRLDGQFGCAIYDARSRELFLARDRVGITPLFYCSLPGSLAFASEIKALLTDRRVSRSVDLAGLDQVFSLPGLVSPHTLFKSVRSLRPGHYLRVRDESVSEHEYWDLIYPEERDLPPAGDALAHAQRLEEALVASIGSRLQADVPVGFYLSGGLDSSLIAALVHAQAPGVRRHSFAISFENAALDERRFQRLMAEQVGSTHHEAEFGTADVLSRLDTVIYHTECPLREAYDTCSLRLSELVHAAGLKVILTGEGADELFGGYVGYRFDQAPRHEQGSATAEQALERELRAALWGSAGFKYERDLLSFRETKRALYAAPLADQLHEFECTRPGLIDTRKVAGRHPFHRRSYLDFKLRMADHLLGDHGDRMAYAHSVEARYPFLSNGVIDTARSIPPAVCLAGGLEKAILRQVGARHVPAPILSREKFGFVAPGSPELLRQGAPWIEHALSPETVRRQGYFNPDAVERLKARYTREGFVLDPTFEVDLLMPVLTFGLMIEKFELPLLG